MTTICGLSDHPPWRSQGDAGFVIRHGDMDGGVDDDDGDDDDDVDDDDGDDEDEDDNDDDDDEDGLS